MGPVYRGPFRLCRKCARGIAAAAEFDFASLLHKMADLEWLAKAPAEGERGAQFSSYDRASRLFNGLKVGWFANGDFGHFLETRTINGRSEAVLAEIDGPGAIVRIWTANPEGVLRIYLDGQSEPVVQMPFAAAVRGDGALPFAEPFAALRPGRQRLLSLYVSRACARHRPKSGANVLPR